MPKRRAARRAPTKRTKHKPAGKNVVLVLAFCLATSGLAWAGWGHIGARFKARPVGTALPAPTVQGTYSPTNPSKEYVYAGGRLVATEEPSAAPPATPTNLRLEEYTENAAPGQWGTLAYRLRWDDNANNEAGYKLERRQLVNGQWAAWVALTTVGPNATTYSIGPSHCNFELFRVRAMNGVGDSGNSNELYVSILNCYWEGGPPSCTQTTSLIISEFRLRGAAGARDEFVELYNNSDGPVSVCTNDGSSGWTLAARAASGASAGPVFTVPNGTVIPARGHFLGVNASPSGGYSLGNTPAGVNTTATGDATYDTDIDDNSGIALFKTANPDNFNAANRLDAAGFGGAAGALPDLYREGAGLASVGAQNGNYTLYRKMTSASGGRPQDTGDNTSDFQLVATDGGLYGGVRASLGAPGPENLSSPVQRNSSFSMTNLDPSVGSSSYPNRERDFGMVPNGAFGTLNIRRTVTNYTGAAVTRLRFRLVSVTTYPQPSGVADLRALTSGEAQVQVQGVWRTVKGTTLEQPPGQFAGGGFNSAMAVSLPQPLAPGATVDVQFRLGVQQTGSFTFLVNIEALP